MATIPLNNLADRTRNFVLIVLSLLFVCIIFWILITIFSAQSSSKVPPSTLELAAPLNPVLDNSKLDRIESKRYYSPEELQSFPINAVEQDEKLKTSRVIRIDP